MVLRLSLVGHQTLLGHMQRLNFVYDYSLLLLSEPGVYPRICLILDSLVMIVVEDDLYAMDHHKQT